jgi:hypothetical protein
MEIFVANMEIQDPCGCLRNQPKHWLTHINTLSHVRKTKCFELWICMKDLERKQDDASFDLLENLCKVDTILKTKAGDTSRLVFDLSCCFWNIIDTSFQWRSQKRRDGSKIWFQTRIPVLLNMLHSIRKKENNIEIEKIIASIESTTLELQNITVKKRKIRSQTSQSDSPGGHEVRVHINGTVINVHDTQAIISKYTKLCLPLSLFQ